jgi:Domain of unknown function (DUF4136)
MKLKLAFLPLLLMPVSGFAQDVHYNFDKGAKFSDYKTYKWVQIKDQTPLDELSDRQLTAAIDAELAKKGLTKVTGDQPADLLIDYQFALGQEKQFTSYSTDFGYGPGWGRGWYGGGGMGSSTTTGQTSTIHIGAIGLDMYDAAAKKLVWRGEASKTLNPKAKPDKRQKNINKAVAKLLKNYPPPVKA